MKVENEKILSRLNDKIKLKPYNIEEANKILQYRSEIAFKDGAVNENIIEMISEIVLEHKNIRHGIEILRKAGMYADKEGLEIISADIIRDASNEVYPTFRGEIIDQLNDQELLSLYGITQSFINKGEPFTLVDDAYDDYVAVCENFGVEAHVKMSFRKYVRQLNSLKIIKSRTVRIEDASRGRHLEITLLDIPVRKLLEFLDEILAKKFK